MATPGQISISWDDNERVMPALLARLGYGSRDTQTPSEDQQAFVVNWFQTFILDAVSSFEAGQAAAAADYAARVDVGENLGLAAGIAIGGDAPALAMPVPVLKKAPVIG